MVSDWEQYSLGELCEFRGGAVFKPHLQGNVSGEIPFVKVSDMNLPSNSVRILEANNWVSRSQLRELKAKPLPPGAVVFAKIGEALRQNRLRQIVRDTIVDNNMMGAVPREENVDPRFFYYALSKFDFSHIAQGTALPYLTITSLSALSLEVPALSEQRAIAHILGTLDDKIELNRRMNGTLEAIARAIFKSWFVDFDPVRAKASGEPPESMCRRLGLTPDLLALFPDRLVDSELGEIPAGWEVGSIADHCDLNAESWTAKTIPEQLHYVDLANTKNGVISEVQLFSSSAAPSRARRVLRSGDTIVGTVRPGNCSFSLIGEGAPQLTGSTGFAVLTPKRPELRELVYFLSTSDENIERLGRLADGAAYPAVRPEVVTAGTCVVPTRDVIDAFHEAIATMINYQMASQIRNGTLAAMRDALLPQLLSGELRAPVEGAA